MTPVPPSALRFTRRWGVLAAEVLLGRKSGPGYPNFTDDDEMKGEGRGSPAGLPSWQSPLWARGPRGLGGLPSLLESSGEVASERGGPAAPSLSVCSAACAPHPASGTPRNW